jgi:hypothetical protein
MFDLIKKDKIFQGLAFVLILAIPFSNANGFIKGFRGQFVPTPYPQTWYQVNEILNKDRANFRVWILPWHQYMYFRFAQKVIVNPGPNFFDKPTVGGDNIEFRSEDIYTQSTNPESKYLENLITNGRQITDLGSQIKSHNFKYIILAKEVDWQNYSWLDQQKDLEAIFDSEELKVYQNKSYENK